MEGFPPEKDQAYQQAFDAFDKDKDGRLTLEELKICMRAVGENIDQGRLQVLPVNI